MADPGWYPDEQYPGWELYFDGQSWTSDRRPVGTAPSAVEPPPLPYAAAPYAAAPYPSAPYGSGPPGIQAPASAGRSRRPLVIALAAGVAVVLIVVIAVVALHGRGTQLTYEGKDIANASAVLASQENRVQAMVRSRHGVESSDSRCYFAQPDNPTGGAKKTDVVADLLCGPVRFVDDTPNQDYLRFSFRTQPASGGKVTVVADTAPLSSLPAGVPSGYRLKRPDGDSPPSGNGGLRAPTPPPAPANTFLSADLGPEQVPAAPATAVIGSLHGGLKLLTLGQVSRYGTYDAARSAPRGQKLIAFTLGAAAGNNGGLTSLATSASVVVGSGTGQVLPAATAGDYVIAVPSSASPVNLVVADGGVTQTLSLLNGQPGTSNLAVLARTNRLEKVSNTQTLNVSFSASVVTPHGGTTSDSITVATTQFTLFWWAGPSSTPAASPSTAWLIPTYSITDSDNAETGALPASMLSFTPTGGSPIQATNLAGGSEVEAAFAVPAGVTTGTMTFSGSSTQEFVNVNSSFTATITTPISIPVSIPAG